MHTDELFPTILDSISEGVIAVDREFRITYLNAAAQQITGRSLRASLGQRCFAVLRASVCQDACPMQHSMRTGQPMRDVSATLLDAAGSVVPICVSTAVVRDRDGGVGAGVEILRDVSELENLRQQPDERGAQGTPVEMIGLLERALALCREGAPGATPVAEVEAMPPAAAVEMAAAWEELEEIGEPVAVVAEVPAGSLRPSEHRALAAAREATGEPNTPLADAEVGRPEVQALIDVLDAHHWNRNATAATLGISRGTLWRRMKEYGLI